MEKTNAASIAAQYMREKGLTRLSYKDVDHLLAIADMLWIDTSTDL